MRDDAKVSVNDGVAVAARGDAFLIVYQRPARLHRTQWLFQQMHAFLGSRTGSIVALMVVLPSADPPDGPTRAENEAQLRKVGHRLRRLVTAPVGDAFRVSIVRAVMRALAIIQGKAGVHFVCDTIDEGIRRLLESASDDTPSRAELGAMLGALHKALGESYPAAASQRAPLF
ncbi:MAG: hypothetical protein U0414_28665 [Polyangiaceae bacterium]